MKKSLIAAFLFLLLFGKAEAQTNPSTYVTLTGSTGMAATTCVTAAGTGQQTATIPSSGAGNYNYIDFLMMSIEATGVVVAVNPVPFTTTNIPGAPSFSAPQAALTIGQVVFAAGGPLVFHIPLRGAINTSQTIVGPAAITNASQRITVCYHVAP